MCFASSIVESHKKLFIEPTEGASSSNNNKFSYTDKRSSGSSKPPIMSRSKSRIQTELCGDCGATDPSWASINRGILLCSDCCTIHRSLGRHISIVKSLRQGTWEPSVLNFVNSLNAHGANSVWEHTLLDAATTGGKNAARIRKPTPKDALHPTKSDFIKAKHVNLQFVLKPSMQDDDDVAGSNLEHELSKQLHASVRTSNLETSLRLLVQGADPNFFHEEKRSTPLHNAAKFGQASQIELLLVYGADINAIDGNGLTPLEVAKANNHNTIAERLLDAMYEVTDRIILFLGGKKPDHASGRHLVVPETNANEISEQLKIARNRLQLVPNKMFEELVMDLYDEVDRRENEAIWSTSALNADNVSVPFLPANPFLSATRNQGRQKLARFTRAEFAGLLTDVLIDALRRQKLANLRPLENTKNNTTSIASFCNTSTSTAFNQSGVALGMTEHDPNLSDDEPIYDPVASDDDYAQVPPPIAQQSPQSQTHKQQQQQPVIAHVEVETLRKQLSEKEYEIYQLRNVVQKLSSENSELKSKFSNPTSIITASNTSVYDEPLRIDLGNGEANDNETHDINANHTGGSNSSSATSSATNSNQSTIKRPASMYEQRRLLSSLPKTNTDARNTTSMYAGATAANEKPLSEDLKRHTDIVTRCLKDLVISLHDATGLLPCAERIRSAVMELIAVFTNPSNYNETIREMLKQLTRYNILIQHECENLQKSYENEDKAAIEKFTFEVRQCAYYIASTIKTLVVQFD